MSRIADQVREFHEVFGCAINEGVGNGDLNDMRFRLIVEEVNELEDALYGEDIVEVADALGDIAYVVFGAALTFGIDLDAVLDEIHASNMSKLDPGGKPIYREDGKVLKGPNYFRPNIRKVLGLEKEDA